MREIKFRGKRLDNGEWVYGDYHHRAGGVHCIIDMQPDFQGKVVYVVIQVAPDTIGQFTGLHDKNGKEIYEGDIIVSEDYSHARHDVRYIDDEAMYVAMIIDSSLMEYCYIRQSWIDKFSKKIIGNIHDNPELLNE